MKQGRRSEGGREGVPRRDMFPPTYKLCRFVLPLVDVMFKRLFHHIDKLYVALETTRDDVVDSILEICSE